MSADGVLGDVDEHVRTQHDCWRDRTGNRDRVGKKIDQRDGNVVAPFGPVKIRAGDQKI